MFKRKPKRVGVLGCGPAGMFATHAFVEAGWDVQVYSRKRRSDMFGAQYLHRPIPGLPEISRNIDYQLVGTPEEYRAKVYGQQPTGTEVHTSADTLVGVHPAWDIRAAYFAAYERYEDLIVDMPGFDSKWVTNYQATFAGKHVVVSSVPAPALCAMPNHKFYSQKIWAAGDAPEHGRFSPISCATDTVICNGEQDRAWYRISNVFGHSTAEWPYNRKPPISDLAEVTKPLWTNCDCHSKEHFDFYRIGRYGRWQKGVLSHHAYEDACAIIAGKPLRKMQGRQA